MSPDPISALEQCPVCEYDLSGLPAAHACPECGFEYDESTIVCYGSRAGRNVQPGLAALFTYLAIISAMGGRPFVALALVAATGYVIWEFIRNRRRFKTRGGKTQLLACGQGVSLREGPGPPDLVPWSRIRQYRLRRYYWAGLSWRKPLPPAWHVSFSSGSLFDPVRLTGRMPPRSRGRVYIDLVIDGSRAEADRIDRVLRSLYESSREPSHPAA